MPAKSKVRKANSSDIPAIREIARVTWAKTYEGIIPREIQQKTLENWYSPSALENGIHAEGSIFLVAEHGGELVGFSQFMKAANHARRTFKDLRAA